MPELRQMVAARTATPRAHLAIRRSPLFDRAWYQQVTGRRFATRDLAIADYLSRGEAAGDSPHPLFDPRWYARRAEAAARSRLGPLAHYLQRGPATPQTSTHPVVDAKRYLAHHPEAADHPSGVVGHFLQQGWRQGARLNGWFDPRAYAKRHPDRDHDEPEIVDFLRRVQPRLAAVPDHRDFPRYVDHFDVAASEHFIARVLAAFAASPAAEDPPLVSVILPTRDRAEILPRAIGSVLAQTYPHVELLVVDDGSRDDIAGLVEHIGDDRARCLTQPPSGVAAARNLGLRHARGDYVAYLDSDNAWEPRFVEVMVAALATGGHRVAYSALELDHGGETRYRGVPFDRGALLQKNYIDCNTVVHERSLAEEVGGWDEQLRRTNDWDFVIRLTGAATPAYVPVIGVRYDHDYDRGDRITVREPAGYRARVRAKHLLDWQAAAEQPTEPGLVSVVISARDGADIVRGCLRELRAHTPSPYEVVVVDNGGAGATPYYLQLLQDAFAELKVVRSAIDLYDSVGPGLGLVETRGEVVVLLDPAARVRPGWLKPLLAPLRAGKASATGPRLITPQSTVVSAGYLLPAHGIPYEAFRDFPEHAPEVRESCDRQALSGACLAVRRADLVALEGLEPMLLAMLQDVDLCLRLAEATGRPARYVADSTVVLHPGRRRKGDDEPGVDDQSVFEERWADRLAPDEDEVLGAVGLRTVFHELGDREATRGLAVHRPVLDWVRQHPARRRWAIKIGPRSVEARDTWGDWHFALALQRELEARGQAVVIDLRTCWYRPTAHLDEVVLNLRGIIRYVPNPDHCNLMWLISHPDLVTGAEAGRYDHVLVASHRFTDRLAARTRAPVEAMLQCTDAQRFTPGPVEADGAPVLFVGNSRRVLRPIVRDAIEAGLDLHVYGGGWRGLIPKRHLKGEFLPNEELPAAYRSAGAVLNDHWEDMGREGFVSNRLFDLAACGARVVSDHVEGIEELFDGLVRVTTGPHDLADRVEDVRASAEAEAARREALAERVRREHSFAARADTLIEVAERHAARRAGSPT